MFYDVTERTSLLPIKILHFFFPFICFALNISPSLTTWRQSYPTGVGGSKSVHLGIIRPPGYLTATLFQRHTFKALE